MYFYEVGYWSYEESPSYTLINEKEFSKEEFDDLVSNCAFEVLMSINESMYDSFQDITSKIIDILEDKHGFKQPIIKSSFNPFGWASVYDKNDWKPQVNDEQLELIRSKVEIEKRDKKINKATE